MAIILPSGLVNVEHFMGYMSRILFLRFVKIVVLLLKVNPIHVRKSLSFHWAYFAESNCRYYLNLFLIACLFRIKSLCINERYNLEQIIRTSC